MRKIELSFAFLLISALAMAQHITPAMKGSTDVAVVVNGNNTITDVSSADLRMLLSGEKKFWAGRAPVQLVLRQPGSRELDIPIAKLLRISGKDFCDGWRSRVFRGEAQSEPTYVPSNGMAAQFSRDLPGALTLLAAHDLPGDVKVLKVDGKLPGDPGYPLR
jgi:hypothetical protein